MTSCAGTPLPGRGEYPAHIACALFSRDETLRNVGGAWMDGRFAKITQDGRDGEECPGYVCNLGDGWSAGYKYFDCRQVRALSLVLRGSCRGHITLRLKWDGEVIARIPVAPADYWTTLPPVETPIPDGVQALYLGFEGTGAASILSFTLHAEA